MKYTKDNPKLVDNIFAFKRMNTFTGVVKDKDNNIVYYLNGKYHREDGPAIEKRNGDKWWYLNGKRHREDGPAVEWSDGYLNWFFNDECHGWGDSFTNESWIRFVQLQLLK